MKRAMLVEKASLGLISYELHLVQTDLNYH